MSLFAPISMLPVAPPLVEVDAGPPHALEGMTWKEPVEINPQLQSTDLFVLVNPELVVECMAPTLVGLDDYMVRNMRYEHQLDRFKRYQYGSVPWIKAIRLSVLQCPLPTAMRPIPLQHSAPRVWSLGLSTPASLGKARQHEPCFLTAVEARPDIAQFGLMNPAVPRLYFTKSESLAYRAAREWHTQLQDLYAGQIPANVTIQMYEFSFSRIGYLLDQMQTFTVVEDLLALPREIDLQGNRRKNRIHLLYDNNEVLRGGVARLLRAGEVSVQEAETLLQRDAAIAPLMLQDPLAVLELMRAKSQFDRGSDRGARRGGRNSSTGSSPASGNGSPRSSSTTGSTAGSTRATTPIDPLGPIMSSIPAMRRQQTQRQGPVREVQETFDTLARNCAVLESELMEGYNRLQLLDLAKDLGVTVKPRDLKPQLCTILANHLQLLHPNLTLSSAAEGSGALQGPVTSTATGDLSGILPLD